VCIRWLAVWTEDKENIMLFPGPQRRSVCYHVNLPAAVSDRLEALREQYPEYAHEALLAAACTFGIEWFLEDKLAQHRMLQVLWREGNWTREEQMWRLGVKIFTGKVEVPRVTRWDQKMAQKRKLQRWSDQAQRGC
jgi:hypothetical protein